MKKWILEKGPELIPVPIDPRHYKQLLAEIAELLLDSYCQLQRIKSRPIGSQGSPQIGNVKRIAERSGSNE